MRRANEFNAEDFRQIIQDSLEITQEYLLDENRDLTIKSLTEENFIDLRKAIEISFPKKINWNYIINEKLQLEDDGGFNFGFMWESQNKLVGACISAYKPSEKCLEIYAIEQFGEPLTGRMLEYSLYVSRFLLTFVQGMYLKLVDVEINNNKLRDFYKSYGFEACNSSDLMITFDKLVDIVANFNLQQEGN